MKFTKSVLVFLNACFLQAGVISAQESITIAVDQGNPPFMFEKDGAAAGLYPQMITAIFKKMGENVTIKALPWKRALEMSANGECGVGGIYKNDERMKIYDYSDAIYSEDLLVYVPKGKSFTFSGIADLKGKKIGTILGWSYGDEFDNAKKDKLFTVEEVNNDLSNLKKLASGYLDCVVTIGLTGKQITTQNGLIDKVEALAKPLSKNATYIVFAKKADKAALITKFNTTMAAMKAEGSYDKITQ